MTSAAFAMVWNAHRMADGLIAAGFIPAAGRVAGDEARNCRRLSGYGYFILLFGLLEAHVDRLFQDSRGDPAEFPFTRRVTEIYGPRTETSAFIGEFYAARCDIAHGRYMDLGSIDTDGFAAMAARILGDGA